MRLSIQKKIILVYSVAVIVVFSSLNIVAGAVIEGKNSDAVKSDILSYRENCLLYIEQAFTMNGLQLTGENFISMAPLIGTELAFMSGRDIAVFSSKGTPVYYSAQNVLSEDTEDINYALEGREAYTTVNIGNAVTVYHTFAIRNDSGEAVGLIRAAADFTDLYADGERTLTIIFYFTLAALLISFGLLMVFLHSVISPIKKLTEAIARTSDDPSKLQAIYVDRTDEIGALAEAYNRMSLVIKRQIDTIENERDTLRRILQYKKSFFDNVTHELKTPLTIITGYAELLRDNEDDAQLRKTGLEHIISESDRLKNMVVEILETSKATLRIEEQIEPVPLSPLLEEITGSMSIKARRYGSEIIFEPEDELEVMAVDEKLRQVFINLIDNAVKYGVPGEPITVRCCKRDDCALICVSNRIANTDIGELESLFEPYYHKATAVREEGSMGIGLHICREIIASFGGSIGAGMEGDNVVFSTKLPLAGK